MHRIVAVLLLFSLAIAACDSERPPVGTENPAVDLTERFDALLEEYFEHVLEFSPVFATQIGDGRYNDRYPNSIGPEYRDAVHAYELETLERLSAIDRQSLDTERQTSFDVLRYRLETSIAGQRFPDHLAPMNQFRSAAMEIYALQGRTQWQRRTSVRHGRELRAVPGSRGRLRGLRGPGDR